MLSSRGVKILSTFLGSSPLGFLSALLLKNTGPYMEAVIEEKMSSDHPLSLLEARWLYEKASDESLRRWSSLRRGQFHHPEEATYLIMGIINFTNICVARCDYCSFYRLPGQKGGYLLEIPDIKRRIDSQVSLGGTMVGFNSGFHPGLTIDTYARIFEEIHQSYPDITFYDMTVAEFIFTCQVSKVSYEQGLQTLKNAGTRWITGGGAEVLAPSFRKRHSPKKFSVPEYYKAQRAILDAGVGSTATMVIGFDETLEERLEHLETLRDFQDSVTNPLVSFLCWTYKPWNNRLGGQEVSTKEYLRWLAVCRLYLHNFTHIRTSVLTKNEGALEGLRYGANDFDLPTEDEVTQKAGAQISLDFERILESCRQHGFKPQMRKNFSPTPRLL